MGAYGTNIAKTETIAIPWTHSPVASKLGASHLKQSKPRASHFVSWNYATVSYILLMPVPFLLLFFHSSKHIRYIHIAAKATMFAAISINADVRLPRVRLRRVHAQAYLTPYAAALDAGRPNRHAVDHAFRFAVELVFIGQTAVPVPLLIRSAVPGADPQHTAGHAVQIVMLLRVKLACPCCFPRLPKQLLYHFHLIQKNHTLHPQ